MKSKQSNQSVEQSLRDHYAGKQLSDRQLQRLKDILEATQSDAPQVEAATKEGLGRKFYFFAMVCATLIIASVAVNHQARYDIDRQIADEVALNHNKQLRPDFLAESVETLSRQMSDLDFKLVLPEKIRASSYRLVGSRYCSIGGQLAAQLRLTNSAQQPVTLYVTPLSEKLGKLRQDEQTQAELKIVFWQEQGLFYALAEPRQSIQP